MCPLLLFLFIKAHSCLFKPIYLLCFLEFKILSCRLKKKKKTALPANVDTLGLVVKAVGLCSSLKETLFYQNNGIDYKTIIKILQDDWYRYTYWRQNTEIHIKAFVI